MKKQSFLGGVLVLFLGSLIAKFLGAVYRIPLTWILSVEGLGIYQLVFPIFSLVLVMSSTGMPTAISKMIAKRAGNIKDANKILKVSVTVLSCVGLLFGLVLFLGAGFISSLQGNKMATLPFMAISPSVVFVAIISAFRGYFQGKMNMLPTSMSNIFEQLFKLIFGLSLAFLFAPKGLEYGVMGAILGVTLSEVVTMLYMILVFLIDKKKKFSSVTINYSGLSVKTNEIKTKISYSKLKQKVFSRKSLKTKEILKEVVKTSFPIVLASVIIPLSLFIDSFLVVNLLVSSGLTSSQSTILFGIDSGVVTSIVNLPVVLSLCVATALVPNLVAESEQKEKRLKQSMLISTNISLPCAFGVMVLSGIILKFLYGGSFSNEVIDEFSLASTLLSCSSFLIFFTAILQTQNASLQGLGHSKIPVINLSVALVLKTILIFLLVRIPSLNIFGVMIAKYAFFLTAVTLNEIYMFKKGYKTLSSEMFVSFASSILMAFGLIVFENFDFNFSVYILLPLEILFAVVLFALSYLCLSPSSLKNLKFKKQSL